MPLSRAPFAVKIWCFTFCVFGDHSLNCAFPLHSKSNTPKNTSKRVKRNVKRAGVSRRSRPNQQCWCRGSRTFRALGVGSSHDFFGPAIPSGFTWPSHLGSWSPRDFHSQGVGISLMFGLRRAAFLAFLRGVHRMWGSFHQAGFVQISKLFEVAGLIGICIIYIFQMWFHCLFFTGHKVVHVVLNLRAEFATFEQISWTMYGLHVFILKLKTQAEEGYLIDDLWG